MREKKIYSFDDGIRSIDFYDNGDLTFGSNNESGLGFIIDPEPEKLFQVMKRYFEPDTVTISLREYAELKYHEADEPDLHQEAISMEEFVNTFIKNHKNKF